MPPVVEDESSSGCVAVEPNRPAPIAPGMAPAIGPDARSAVPTLIEFLSDEEADEALAYWKDRGLRHVAFFPGPVSRAGNLKNQPCAQHSGRVVGCLSVHADEMLHVCEDGKVVQQPGMLKAVRGVGWSIPEYGCAQVSMTLRIVAWYWHSTSQSSMRSWASSART